MTLFKYIRPERIDVIQNLEIRFTQPDALNDPFELHPPIESIVAEADVLSNLPDSPIDLRPMVAQAYNMLPELKVIPMDVAMHAVEEFNLDGVAEIAKPQMYDAHNVNTKPGGDNPCSLETFPGNELSLNRSSGCCALL